MRDPATYALHKRHRAAQGSVATHVAREVVQEKKVSQGASLRPWRGHFRVGATSLEDLGDYRRAFIGSAAHPSPRRALAACKRRGQHVPIAEIRDLQGHIQNLSPAMKRLAHHLRSRLHGRLAHHNRARRAQRWKARHT